MREHTPKNFIIQFGSLITLYVSITALMMLLFGIININFPDDLRYYGTAESAREMMRVAIAMLIVFFPTYITLTRVSNQNRRQDEGGEYTTLAKWLVYASLLVGGGVLLGDLVTVINYFLNGEITTRFILKALALFVVVGVAFSYYLLDARGHFKENVKQSVLFGLGIGVFVLLTLVYGLTNIETPTEVREMKLDEQQVNDLRNIQMEIEAYYNIEDVLPESLVDLYEDRKLPEPAAGRSPYTYDVIDEYTYNLCASFSYPSEEDEYYYRDVYFRDKTFSWDHGAGERCFKRNVESAIPGAVKSETIIR